MPDITRDTTPEQLIEIIIQNPDSNPGKIAKAVLEFRLNDSIRKYNLITIILTTAVALSTLIQVLILLYNFFKQ